MKSIILTGSAALLLFFSSCKKDDSTTGAETTIKIKTYTEDVTSESLGHQSETYNLTYDDKNRLVSMVSSTNAGNKFIYQYPNEKTFTFDLYLNNSLNIHEDLFLNAQNLVDSTFQYNDTQDSSTEKYIYNSAKQLVKVYNYDYTTSGGSVLFNTTNYTYDGNGNTITQSDLFTSTTYSYDSSVANVLNINPLHVPAIKSLPSKTVSVVGGISYTFDHEYTFDSEKRLTKDKATGSEGSIIIKSYTY